MRFFTRRWCDGSLSDEEVERTKQSYQKHIERLAPDLPGPLCELALDLNLHDGLFRQVVLHSTKGRTVSTVEGTLTIKLRCGDLQVGYFDLDLNYSEAELRPMDYIGLKQAAYNPRIELLYDEVDIEEPGKFVHRIIFWPKHETSIRFSEFRYDRQPKKDRDFSRGEEMFIEVGSESA